jgi:uroporphyrin-III C-methyltransferase/precorrin-2 dehydrogenase/sirohydrochlorin ferrochelatase/uroporphyrin-III C-methyltransferase
MIYSENRGKVIFAGAGPGDPELLTLKALRYLQQAEVVISDRLVSNVILDQYVNNNAIVLRSGKQSGKQESTPQSLINELMVDYALHGKLVVRLKGGDVSIFSNIMDELRALSAHGIRYEIVPGITAASGAAAYAGIPLTARDYSNAVRFLTYYKTGVLEDSYWQDLAKTDDTLVFYMSSGNLEELIGILIRYGIARDKFLSVIQQATTPMQHVHTSGIYDYLNIHTKGEFLSPTLIIVGKVAALQSEFQWIIESNDQKSYFEPLRKRIQAEERA